MAAVKGSFQHYFYRGVPFYVWIDARSYEYCLDTRQINIVYPKAAPVFACRFHSHAAALLAGKKMIERAYRERDIEPENDELIDIPPAPVAGMTTRRKTFDKQRYVISELAKLSSFTAQDLMSLDPADPRTIIRKLLQNGLVTRAGRGRYVFTDTGRSLAIANPIAGKEKYALLAAGAVSAILILIGIRKALAPALSSSFGNKVVAGARHDLGTVEGSSRVSQMLANFGIHFQVNWCAVAVGTWVKDAAARAGVAMPIAGSASAKSTMVEFQDTSNPRVGWVYANALQSNPSLVAPGMVVIWQRGPTASWLGHIGVVTANLGNGKFRSIEGNAGSGAGAVVESTHDLSASSLLGMGFFRDDAVYANPATGVAGVGMLGAVPVSNGPDSIEFGFGRSITIEVADTDAKRTQGLMFRQSMPTNHGMWFEFPDTRVHPFWMKNTYIPLDIVFVDERYRVVGVLENMQPLSTVQRSIGVPSRYAIELNAGQARALGIRTGQIATRLTPLGSVGYYPDPADVETFAPPGA